MQNKYFSIEITNLKKKKVKVKIPRRGPSGFKTKLASFQLKKNTIKRIDKKIMEIKNI